MGAVVIVCSLVLVGLLLAPATDGRLKYAEVLPGGPDGTVGAKVFHPPGPPVTERGTGAGGGPPIAADRDRPEQFHRVRPDAAVKDAAKDGDFAAAGDDDDDDDGGDDDDGAADDSGSHHAPNCFRAVDRMDHHQYDWARYRLQQLVLRPDVPTGPGSGARGYRGHRPDVGAGETPEEELAAGVAKRNDYNRELSFVDLYAQYPSSCACETRYELLDLGYTHFPRYILTAICQQRGPAGRKCWRGSSCKEIPYQVRVLTKRTDGESGEQDHQTAQLPEPLRDYWRFQTVTITAACQCSI